MSDDKTTIDELRAKHGRIAHVKTPNGLVACRPPSAAEHQRLCDKMGDSRKSDYAAQKELVYACRISPSTPEAFTAIVEAYPALVNKLADAIVTLAGADLEVSTGE